MKSVLFVCMSNVCRSPALGATLRHLAGDELYVDSCGLKWVSEGQDADPRSVAAAVERGIVIEHQAQCFDDSFFDVFDYIFAMDEEMVDELKFMAGRKRESKIFLATAFSAKYKDQAIGDPYRVGFELVMDQVVDSCKGIYSKLC